MVCNVPAKLCRGATRNSFPVSLIVHGGDRIELQEIVVRHSLGSAWTARCLPGFRGLDNNKRDTAFQFSTRFLLCPLPRIHLSGVIYTLARPLCSSLLPSFACICLMLSVVLRQLLGPFSLLPTLLTKLSGTSLHFHTISFIIPACLLFLLLCVYLGMNRPGPAGDAAAHPVRRAPRASSSTSTLSTGSRNSAAQQPQLLTRAPRALIHSENPKSPLPRAHPPHINTESAQTSFNTSIHDSPVDIAPGRNSPVGNLVRPPTEIVRTGPALTPNAPVRDIPAEAFNKEKQPATKGLIGLPPEILLTIFQYSFPCHTTFPQSSSSLPLPLRRVCRFLRTFVDGAPELWSSLNPSLKNTGCTPEILSWYKDLTGRLSNIKTFDYVVIRVPMDGDICKELLKHLLDKISTRSKAIKLELPRHLLHTDTMVQNSFSPTLPAEDLPMSSNGPLIECLRTIDWTLPGLRFQEQISDSLCLPWSNLHALPWHRLTSVTLCLSMTMHDCIFILNNTPEIEHLVLRTIEGPLTVSYPDDTTRSLCHLRSLTIASEVSLLELFRSYTMPGLCTLHLELGREANADLDQLSVWKQLAHVTLDCDLSVQGAGRVVQELAKAESLAFKRGVTGDEAWVVHNPLPNLGSFTLAPGSNNGKAMVMHFAEHVFPSSIRVVNIPSIPRAIWSSTQQPFGSLGVVILSSPILLEDFISLLHFAKKLCKGVFKVRDEPRFSQPTLGAIKHNINSLELDLDLEHTPSQLFLGALTLPRLISFIFTTTRRTSGFGAFLDLLKRSMCPITKLTFSCHGVGDEGALEILQHLTRTLEDFDITDPSFTEFGETLLRGLTHETNGTSGALTRCLCPRLERLNLSRCVNSPSFREMFLSRSQFPNKCGSCGEVKKLKFVGAVLGSADEDRSGWKRELKDMGIDYELETRPSFF
ncbi:hypothetical protein P691DRAFT_774061 [Macrolepiota fuliginosa MF-IS2]|uniref:F-box domain-containing protein n=1 Tax=Macrolepiota fuliginosa MF-IS2 TaxID=1400762 RepID=A0A9P5XGG4_9AGAR|nr:hypothetical protein P691DRAFT_774061 [Macrolepiota fuliginosa MF-IS2]